MTGNNFTEWLDSVRAEGVSFTLGDETIIVPPPELWPDAAVEASGLIDTWAAILGPDQWAKLLAVTDGQKMAAARVMDRFWAEHRPATEPNLPE